MADSKKIKIGIIGGSGFDDPTLFEEQTEHYENTPFGAPSDALIEGKVKGVPCVLLARHGRKHQFQPSDINYRANIWALKQRGCTHILATTATGSLQEEYRPGDLVVLDDYIDRTWGRKCTFFDRTEGGPRGVCHVPQRPAFCPRARAALAAAARARGYSCHAAGTAVVIQGPRFSSRAESLMHRQWGGHLVNMTTVPEVVLAKEAGLSYAAVALVTDYDCWRDNETAVSVSAVLATFARNVQKAADVVLDAVQLLAADTDHSYLDDHQELVSSSIMLKE
ncbi:S-methyl-5'-thioadenosine phosphorylase [Cydia pomonella]|uniref:S-methyl-5'-thioadenosine phosphorylase n=1 Tax=Cydia pomonella TaxID=82600 RepID=UPI002ADE3962|nr:S-methyl-5'-thioadenosine phosphorylase [Cydia pomonella]